MKILVFGYLSGNCQVGAAATVGIHLYFDILSFLFLVGGALGSFSFGSQ